MRDNEWNEKEMSEKEMRKRGEKDKWRREKDRKQNDRREKERREKERRENNGRIKESETIRLTTVITCISYDQFLVLHNDVTHILWDVSRLTAYTLKTLHATVISQWSENVYVPIDILNNMAIWLARQQSSSGAFVETADVYYNQNYRVSQQNRNHVIPSLVYAPMAGVYMN